MADRWIQRWTAIGTSGKQYTVAMDRVGNFGCSCPAWTFSKVRPKPDCQHIMQKQRELAGTHPFPTIPPIPPIPRFLSGRMRQSEPEIQNILLSRVMNVDMTAIERRILEVQGNQSITFTVQPVDANGDPVGPPLSATEEIRIVPGAAQEFRVSGYNGFLEQKHKKKTKKEKIAKKPVRAIELEK